MLAIFEAGKLLHDVAWLCLSPDDPDDLGCCTKDSVTSCQQRTGYSCDHWSWSLTCGVCLEFYTDPVIMPCGHTFCRSCIEKVASFERFKSPRFPLGHTRLRCPKCRSSSKVQPVNFRHTPNLAVSAVLDLWIRQTACQLDKAVQTSPTTTSHHTQTPLSRSKGRYRMLKPNFGAIRLSTGKVIYVRNRGVPPVINKHDQRVSLSLSNTGHDNGESKNSKKSVRFSSGGDSRCDFNSDPDVSKENSNGERRDVLLGSVDRNNDVTHKNTSHQQPPPPPPPPPLHHHQQPPQSPQPTNPNQDPFHGHVTPDPLPDWTYSNSSISFIGWYANHGIFTGLAMYSVYQNLDDIASPSFGWLKQIFHR